MGVPKQHRSKSRQGQRRMHIYLKRAKLTACPKCGQLVLPHTVCKNCGYYKNQEVIDVMKKLTKKERKKKEKEIELKEKAAKPSSSAGGPLSMEELSRK